MLLGVGDVLAEEALIDEILVDDLLWWGIGHGLVLSDNISVNISVRGAAVDVVGVVLGVRVHDEVGEPGVGLGIDDVSDDAENVEARENGVRELNILAEAFAGVVAPANWIGGGDHGAPRLEGGHDAGLGDGDGLLLHRLVRARVRVRVRVRVKPGPMAPWPG